jgi:DNA replication protein DnaC
MISSARGGEMSNLAYERLHHNLQTMKLTTIDSILDNFLELAAKEGQSTIEILDYLIDQEMKSKDAKSLAIRTRLAGFPSPKSVEDFDFGFQPSLDKAVIRELTSLRFIKNAENIVFLGPPGVGKTHLAIGLGLEAVRSGFKVHFTNAATLVERLVNADKQDKLEEKIKSLSKSQLLIMDEIGYLPFTVDGAHAFFQLISRFYETRSIILTSNKSYGEWGEIFNDHVIASAVLDRILHHCITINIKGDSYRLKERRKQGLIPQNR